MALTKRSKVKEIASIPGIFDIMKKHSGQEVSPALLKMAGQLSLQIAASQMGWTEEQLDAMLVDANQQLSA